MLSVCRAILVHKLSPNYESSVLPRSDSDSVSGGGTCVVCAFVHIPPISGGVLVVRIWIRLVKAGLVSIGFGFVESLTELRQWFRLILRRTSKPGGATPT